MTTLESTIESRFISQLANGDSQWTYRGDIRSEEDLWDNIRTKLSNMNSDKLNGHPITDSELEQIKSFIIEKAESTYKAAVWLSGERGVAQIPLRRDDASLGEIFLDAISNRDIASGHSTYEIINQYQSQKTAENDRNRRFDVTLLINGFPMIHIELKNQDHSFMEGFNQIKKYISQGHFRGIFGLVQMFVVSNGVDTRYIAANEDPYNLSEKFLIRWVDKNNNPVTNYLDFARQALNIPQAHLMVGKYSVIDDAAKKLILLRPYQIHAIEAVKEASFRKESGFVWHTTGSGKTITSFNVTRNLLEISSIDKSIFLIDRKDLDQQTSVSFASYAKNTGDKIEDTQNTYSLEQKLRSKDRCVIVTTRQKLDCLLDKCTRALESKDENARYFKIGNEIKQKNVAFVVDECHRAVSGKAKIDIDKFFNTPTKKALWFGFTGTPIFEENKKAEVGQAARTTEDQYGNILHSYTIKEALNDGAVLGFQITPAGFSKTELIKLAVNLHVVEHEEDAYELDSLTLEDECFKAFNKKYKKTDLYDNPKHRSEVIDYIINKSKRLLHTSKGDNYEAILTCSSIEIAQKYYKEFKQFIAEGKIKEHIRSAYPDFPKIAITYSVGENEDGATANQEEMKQSLDDYNKMFGTNFTIETIPSYNRDLNDRLARKKGMYQCRDNQLDLVIVVDRLLTGFDAPCLSTLFIDRQPMSPQGIIQAFSRTNRIFIDEKKYGQIVTFQTPERFNRAFEKALNLYATGGKGNVIAPTYAECKKRLQDAMAEFLGFMANPNNQNLNEHSPQEHIRAYVRKFQALDKAIAAVRTYEEWDNEIEDIRGVVQESSSKEQSISDKENLRLDHCENILCEPTSFDEDDLSSQAVSSISGFEITKSDMERYTGMYNNLLKFIKKPDNEVLDFDIEYRLESKDPVIVDYNYLVSLIQKYIDKGDGPSGFGQINDPSIDKYISKLTKMNPKLGEVVLGIWNALKANPESFKGKKALYLINEKVDEIINNKLSSFADTWNVSLNDLVYSAKYYKEGYVELQTDYSKYKENGGEMSKIRYNKVVKQLAIEMIEQEILPLLRR
ncbi:MAG: HsdR family type I site-specific deoxyribonuclease [Succinivibrio sp.]